MDGGAWVETITLVLVKKTTQEETKQTHPRQLGDTILKLNSEAYIFGSFASLII